MRKLLDKIKTADQHQVEYYVKHASSRWLWRSVITLSFVNSIWHLIH